MAAAMVRTRISDKLGRSDVTVDTGNRESQLQTIAMPVSALMTGVRNPINTKVADAIMPKLTAQSRTIGCARLPR